MPYRPTASTGNSHRCNHGTAGSFPYVTAQRYERQGRCTAGPNTSPPRMAGGPASEAWHQVCRITASGGHCPGWRYAGCAESGNPVSVRFSDDGDDATRAEKRPGAVPFEAISQIVTSCFTMFLLKNVHVFLWFVCTVKN